MFCFFYSFVVVVGERLGFMKIVLRFVSDAFFFWAQSARAVEYSNCISAER